MMHSDATMNAREAYTSVTEYSGITTPYNALRPFTGCTPCEGSLASRSTDEMPTKSTVEGFWTKVDRSGECWEWRGGKDRSGYGRLRFGGRLIQAHRLAYELSVGPIPSSLELDHLCRNRGCVNPHHLEPVTRRENVMRGVGVGAFHARATECPQGHAYSTENTYRDRLGKRYCRICKRVTKALSNARRAASDANSSDTMRSGHRRASTSSVVISCLGGRRSR